MCEYCYFTGHPLCNASLDVMRIKKHLRRKYEDEGSCKIFLFSISLSELYIII